MLLLRSFCIKTGIQILLREYNFDNKQVQTFTGTSFLFSDVRGLQRDVVYLG
jgi:hypothetical protein